MTESPQLWVFLVLAVPLTFVSCRLHDTRGISGFPWPGTACRGWEPCPPSAAPAPPAYNFPCLTPSDRPARSCPPPAGGRP